MGWSDDGTITGETSRLATEEGDLSQGILPVGQVTGLIRDEPTVAEAKQVRERLAGQLT